MAGEMRNVARGQTALAGMAGFFRGRRKLRDAKLDDCTVLLAFGSGFFF
jgi:hypothetical protein